MEDIVVADENAAIDMMGNDEQDNKIVGMMERAQPQSIVPLDGDNALMAVAAQTGNIEVMERMRDMVERKQDRDAQKEFDKKFAKMQAEFTIMEKDSEAYDANKQQHLYNFASLGALQQHFNPAIHKNGFSYQWEEETIESGKRVTIIISGHGAKRMNSFEIPKMPATQRQTAVQAVAGMSTFGQRYTFVAGFALPIKEPDNDGSDATGAKYANEVLDIQSCGSDEELHATWKRIHLLVSTDTAGLRYLTGIKDEKRKEFYSGR